MEKLKNILCNQRCYEKSWHCPGVYASPSRPPSLPQLALRRPAWVLQLPGSLLWALGFANRRRQQEPGGGRVALGGLSPPSPASPRPLRPRGGTGSQPCQPWAPPLPLLVSLHLGK